MPSPFPGMDPYLEGPLWPDVHQELASTIRRQLERKLGPNYVARLVTRTVRDAEPEEDIGIMYPDVGLFRDKPATGTSPSPTTIGSSIATITPVTSTVSTPAALSVRLVRVEIRFVRTSKLVTAIEILSPVNKRGEGLRKYRRKRERLRSAHVHLLEIDLLRRGTRVVPGRRLPQCDYLVALTRARSEIAELWSFSLRDPLPTVPVPLRRSDGELPLVLGDALKSAYDDAGYWKSIDYSQSPPPPELSPEDVAWVREVTNRPAAST